MDPKNDIVISQIWHWVPRGWHLWMDSLEYLGMSFLTCPNEFITAWSMAAILGPQIMDRLSMANKKSMPHEQAYNGIFHLMIGLLIVGLIANLLVRPVDAKHHVKTTAQA
jgi:hypothetical protein